MITADVIKSLMDIDPVMMTRLANVSGYKGDSFSKVDFLGITNGEQFCYRCGFVEDGKLEFTKVFLQYDNAADLVRFEY